MKEQRRLAAIVAADVVAYSRLMGREYEPRKSRGGRRARSPALLSVVRRPARRRPSNLIA